MRWLPLFFISLLLVAAFVPGLLVMAQPNLIPHEDPAAAQSTMDSFSFLTQYAQIFGLISSKDYANASRLSEAMSHITVPADLAYIINRYNNLTQQFIGVLNDTQNTLDNASSLLNQYRLDEAGQALDHAGVLVAQAQILLGELQDATATLSQNFGVFASSAGSKVQQAYNALQSILQQLNNLINEYHALLQSFNQKAQDIKSQNLRPTSLSLGLDATKSFVGGYVGASGVLRSSGQALGSRKVQLLLDEKQVGTTNTLADGSYYLEFQIPFNYVDNVSVAALYTPTGGDRGVYLAAVSPTVRVQVLFYQTILNVSVPNIAYPGLPLTVNGQVASENGTSPIGRQISVLLDSVTMDQVITDQNGLFASTFNLDSTEQLGSHSLTVAVDPSGLYASASVQRTLTVEKMSTFVTVNAPSFVVLPSQLHVTGSVSSAFSGFGPSRGASVFVGFGNASVNVKTLTDGSFNATIDLPISSLIVGYQNLNVVAQPSEPWQATGQTKVSVFALNSVSVGVVLASSLSVFFVAFTRISKGKGKKGQEIGIPADSTLPKQTTTETGISPSSGLKFEGNKGVVLKAYVEALKAVELATGYSLMPNMTLREFTAKTAEKIGEVASAFFELTLLAERSLYSSHESQVEELAKAQGLAGEIGRFLGRGSA